jgi:hypothetical protein
MRRRIKSEWRSETKNLTEIGYLQHTINTVNDMIAETEVLVDRLLDKGELTDVDRLMLRELEEYKVGLRELKAQGIKNLKEAL